MFDFHTPYVAEFNGFFFDPHHSKELLRNAAKARISRMITEKQKRTDLEAPTFLKERWQEGTKARGELAAVLQEANWDKARF